MNIGNQIISCVLQTRDIKQAIKQGLSSQIFDLENAAYWETIISHYEIHSEVPSIDYFREICPGFKFSKPKDSFSALLAEAKTQYLGQSLQEGLVHLSNANSSDPWVARDMLVSLSEKILTGHQLDNTLIKVGSQWEDTETEIKQLQDGGGVIGMPWPWNYLNEKSLGLRDEELFYIYGREATGKTFFNLWLALYYWQKGYKVLFFTRESGHSQLKWRIFALVMRMSMHDVMKGNFTNEQLDRLKKFHSEVESSGRWFCSENTDGITGFKSVAEQINPDIIIHDYFKAMADDAMADKANNQHVYVARCVDQIKDYAMKRKIPIVITGHANRKGVNSDGRNSDEHAWSDHIVRRCDFVVRIITDNELERTALIFNKSRGMEPGIGITFDASKCQRFGDFISADTSWVKEMGNKNKDKNSKAKEFMEGNFKF